MFSLSLYNLVLAAHLAQEVVEASQCIAMAKKGKKGKKKQGQSNETSGSSTQESCDLPGCERFAGAQQPCCGKRMCGECCFHAVAVCTCEDWPKFKYNCAFCREKIGVPYPIVKDMMYRFCPSHAKVMENRCLDGQAVLAHLPCNAGCYGCNESEIRASNL